MQATRLSHSVRAFVLLCYALVVSAASAAPWLAPGEFGLVCSSAAVFAGTTEAPAGKIDCPLCLPTQATPPQAFIWPAAQSACDTWRTPRFDLILELDPVTLPPPRGPPFV